MGSPFARRGMTLTELLVVLTLLGVVAAISWPSLAGAWRRNQVSSTALELQSALTRARSLSVARADGRIYGLAFEPGGAWRLYSFAPDRAVSAANYRDAAVGLPCGEPRALPDIVRLANLPEGGSAPLLVIFRDDGIPTADGVTFPAPDAVLSLALVSDATDYTATVSINRAAGTARVR